MKILVFIFFVFFSFTKAHANLVLSEILNKPEDLNQAFLFVEQEKNNKVNEAIYVLEVLKKIYPENLEIKIKLFYLYEKTKNEILLKKLLYEIKDFENIPSYIVNKINEIIISKDKSKKENNSQISNDNSKGIKYSEILNNPTDLELNLRFAKEQESLGNYKTVIATLERLSDLYSENLDLKLYLLSISLKIDSKERTKTIIDEIKQSEKLTANIREQLNSLTQTLENQKKPRDENDWIRYVDFGVNFSEENNVNTVSNSKTLYISDSLSNYAADTIYEDSYNDVFVRTGAFKKLSDTSNLSLSLGKNITQQNRDKNRENDLDSLFINYNKQFNKNYTSAFFSLNNNNFVNDAENVIYNITLENRYLTKPNQNFLISSNMGITDYRTDNTFSSADNKNNTYYGFATGYEYFLSNTNNIKFKLGINQYDAKLDSYGYENNFYTISNSGKIGFLNYTISHSNNSNEYDKSDTFVKSDTIRDDEIKTNNIILSGNLEDLIKNNYLKNIFYNLSYSDIESRSNILNYDYDKEVIKFGITKRMMF
jgi:hypothetical protein